MLEFLLDWSLVEDPGTSSTNLAGRVYQSRRMEHQTHNYKIYSGHGQGFGSGGTADTREYPASTGEYQYDTGEF